MMVSEYKFAVMFIGASRFDSKAYRTLRDMGVGIVMTDVNPNCPQFKWADEFHVISASDKQSVIRCFESSRLRNKILMAYCGNDFGVLSALTINSLISGCATLESYCQDPNDKQWMKTVFENAGINVPASMIFESRKSTSDILRLVEKKLRFPIVIKPTDASGARGVGICRRKDHFAILWDKAASESNRIMIEEYIHGSHLDLNGYMIDGKFYPSGSSDRFFLPGPNAIMLKNYAPSNLEEKALTSAWKSLELAARAQGLRFGPIKADFIITDNGLPYLLETSIRFHGGLTTCGSMAVSGTSFSVPEMISCLAGDLKERLHENWRPLGAVGTVHIFPGIKSCRSTQDYSMPSRMTGIDSILIRSRTAEVGVTDILRDNRDIHGYIIGFGQTREECDYNVAKALLQVSKKNVS